jgi:hypothetical protein
MRVTNENVPVAPLLMEDRQVHEVGNGKHRSTRAPVPSTRVEKLNEIGMNIAPLKPLPNSTSDTEEPLWFAPAYQHLQRTNLGPAWTQLVEKWAKHKCVKFWKMEKVHMSALILVLKQNLFLLGTACKRKA